jgi:hypothetical protein
VGRRLYRLPTRHSKYSFKTRNGGPRKKPVLSLSKGRLPTLRYWLLAIIVAEISAISPIIHKVKIHHARQPADNIDWADLLETVRVYKLPTFTFRPNR